MKKINYIKRWDSKGYVYDQAVNITKKEFIKIQSAHSKQFNKNNKDIKNKRNYFYKLYLGSPDSCERLNNVVFTNRTQRDFFAHILKIELKDRNTCFIIN